MIISHTHPPPHTHTGSSLLSTPSSGYIISHWSFWYPESYSARYRSLQMNAQAVSNAMQVLPMQIRVCGPWRGNILVDFTVYVTVSELDVSMGLW